MSTLKRREFLRKLAAGTSLATVPASLYAWSPQQFDGQQLPEMGISSSFFQDFDKKPFWGVH